MIYQMSGERVNADNGGLSGKIRYHQVCENACLNGRLHNQPTSQKFNIFAAVSNSHP